MQIWEWALETAFTYAETKKVESRNENWFEKSESSRN